jgi:hypothetical protein
MNSILSQSAITAQGFARYTSWNRRGILSLAAAGLIGFCAAATARADETLKFRLFMHATSAQSLDVGDVDGHAMSLVRFTGLASLPDGSVGTAYFTAATDYTKGAGPFSSVYTNLTLDDGSVLWYKAAGTATVDGAKTLFAGNITVLGGKGRFEGAKGDGTVTGVRLNPLIVGAVLYLDCTINIKK